MKSIRQRLYVYLATSLSLTWLLLALSAVFILREFIVRETDEQMKREALELQVLLEEMVDILPYTRFGEGPGDLTHNIDIGGGALQIYRKGHLVAQTTDSPSIPIPSKQGITDPIIDGVRWRILSHYDKDYDSWLVLGKPYRQIEDAVLSLVPRYIWPILIALPLILLSILVSVKSGLRTLDRVTKEIESRNPSATAPIVIDSPPDEVLPLISSLNTLLARLDDALSSERRFTDNAAHELRTPLAALKTETQFALRNAQHPETVKALQRIHTRVDTASHLISQLLELTRISATKAKNDFSDVNLHRLSLACIYDLADQAMDKDIDIKINDDDERCVYGQQALLSVLIRNLLDNAIKYSPEGGRIQISIENASDGVMLAVSDNGLGISDELIDKIFDPFFREPGTAVAGSGLGMSIVKRITDLHSADISVANLPDAGGGLKVSVVFPSR